MEQRQAVFLLGEGESKSLQMTAEGNDAGVTCEKSRNGRTCNHVLTIDNYMFQRYNFNEIRQIGIIAEIQLKYVFEKWECFN